MVAFLAGAAHADAGAATASSGNAEGGAPRPSRGASGLDWDAGGGGDEGKGAL